MVQLKADETLDDLLIGDLKVIQKKNGFRFTLDSVLLAHFAHVKEGDRVVDLGTGTGIIPLILSTRAAKLSICGVELHEEMVEMAERSVKLNKAEGYIQIRKADIKDIHKTLAGGENTLVTANPPYWTIKEGKHSEVYLKATARHELVCTLEDFLGAAAKLLNYQGRFAMIHRTERLADVFELLRKYELEPRRIRFVHSFAGKSSRHVLIEARRKAPAELLVLPPLVVYRAPGEYTEEVMGWYGKGEDAHDHSD